MTGRGQAGDDVVGQVRRQVVGVARSASHAAVASAAHSALRFYEAEGLVHSERTAGNQRRYHRSELRRIAFIRVAQRVGLSLDEIRDALGTLPSSRAPTEKEWARLSKTWRPRLDAQIAVLEGLRDHFDSCIGCGCLSFKVCRLYNPGDVAGTHGPGPRYLLGDPREGEGDADATHP